MKVILRPSFAASVLSREELKLSVNAGSIGHKVYRVNNLTPQIISNAAFPFYYSIAIGNDKDDFFASDVYLSHADTKGLIEVLKPVFKSELGIQWDGTQKILYTDAVHIYPMSKGDYVYMTERERVAFDKVDPIALLYTRLLWNNLVALNYLEKESIFKSVSSYKNVVVCDSDMLSTLSNREIQSRMLSLDYEVSKIESSGAVDMLFEDEFSRWLSSEIAMVWNFKRTTVHGVDYYSQSPHLLYSVVEEPVISGMKEKIPQSPVLIEEEMPSSYQPLVETAAAADHNESRQEKKFTTSEQSIPYKMTREEFKNFILTAMDAIIAGEIPVIRIYQEDSVVVDSKSSTRVRQELQKKIDERYELLTSKINPWLKGRRGKVGSDLSLNLPVFSPQDLRVILTGNLWGEKKVPSELPGDVFRAEMDGQQKRWVVTSFNTSDTFAIDLGDDTSFPTDPSEKWKRGELLDPWASYVLCSHGYVSCTI